MIECRSKYFRVLLKSKIEKEVYDIVLSALEKRQTEIEIGGEYFAEEQLGLDKIVLYVKMDNPGLFYVDFRKYSIFTYSPSGRRKIVFSLLYEPYEIDRVEEKLRRRIAGIVNAGLKNGLSGYWMELYLHDYLATRVKFESRDRSYHKAHSSVGPLLHGRSVCEGYAMAFKLLCDAAGISCIVVFGDSVQPGETNRNRSSHAWNIVKLSGICCQVDVTWDSCRTKEEEADHTYFNITDRDMAINHSWEQNLFPECLDEKDNYYVRNRTLLKDEREMVKMMAAGLEKGKKQFDFRLRKAPRQKEQLVQAIRDAFWQVPLYRTGGFSYTYTFDEEFNVIKLKVST